MKFLVVPGADGVISPPHGGTILGQQLPDEAAIVVLESLALPANRAARLVDGEVEIIADYRGGGPYYDQAAVTADRLTQINPVLGQDPALLGWGLQPRPETSAEVTARETAEAEALVAAEAARIANLEVARYAALVALLGAGITEAMIVEQLAEISDVTEREHARLYFNRPTWRRTSTFISWGKGAFNLTDQQVDALFVAADAID